MSGLNHIEKVAPQRPESYGQYCITVLGRIGTLWSTWFDGLKVTPGESVTTIEGTLDQATLRGILIRIWDLNLTLISVTRKDEKKTQEA